MASLGRRLPKDLGDRWLRILEKKLHRLVINRFDAKYASIMFLQIAIRAEKCG